MLLYSICLVAAARREVPQAIFDSIRFAVNNVIKAEDVLSTPTIPNVQSLLIMCMTGDCHSQFVPNALSALWIRLGTAIRMVRGSLQPGFSVTHVFYAGTGPWIAQGGISQAEYRTTTETLGGLFNQ